MPLEDALWRLLLLLLLWWEATVSVLLLRWRRADHLALLLHLHLLLLCVIRHLLLLHSVAMLGLLKSAEKVGAAAVRVARFDRTRRVGPRQLTSLPGASPHAKFETLPDVFDACQLG